MTVNILSQIRKVNMGIIFIKKKTNKIRFSDWLIGFFALKRMNKIADFICKIQLKLKIF